MELSLSLAKMELSLSLSLSLSHSRRQLCCYSSFEPWPCRRDIKWHHDLGLVPPSRTLQAVQGQSWVHSVQKKNHKVLCSEMQEAPVLGGSSIEEVYDTLAERLLSTAIKVKDHSSRYIVGLAGPPGAGKTTVASEVVCRVNMLWSQKVLEMGLMAPPDEVATVLPMDGFHLYRSQLDAMENPKEAHARRGAPWTFDPDLLLKCLHSLRSEGSVYAPSFDHGVGDPIENDIFVGPQHKIVLVEGNYLFLEEDSWKEVCAVFDEKWFLDIDIDIAMQRVLKRHIFTGKEPHVAEWRVGYNDRPNAELILKSKKHADLVIKSIDF